LIVISTLSMLVVDVERAAQPTRARFLRRRAAGRSGPRRRRARPNMPRDCARAPRAVGDRLHGTPPRGIDRGAAVPAFGRKAGFFSDHLVQHGDRFG
jgi:hypothetical protein